MNIGLGWALITEERFRQVHELGYTLSHDLGHDPGDLIAAAHAYAIYAWWQAEGDRCGWTKDMVLDIVVGDGSPKAGYVTWPWDEDDFKPADTPKENLVKAGALIAAAVDIQLRLELEP